MTYTKNMTTLSVLLQKLEKKFTLSFKITLEFWKTKSIKNMLELVDKEQATSAQKR